MSLKNTVYDAINSNKFGKAFLKARRDLRGDEARAGHSIRNS